VNQRTLARELGVSQAQLSRYEKGKSEMGAEVLLRISRRFGKSMEWVLTGEDR
jgi:transcriptional regulator with XRE-family HTH domain